MFILEIDKGQRLDFFDMFAVYFSKYDKKTKIYTNITLWEEYYNISVNHSNLGTDCFQELF